MREVFSLDPDRDRDPDPDLYGGFPDSAAAGLLKISLSLDAVIGLEECDLNDTIRDELLTTRDPTLLAPCNFTTVTYTV